MKSCCILGTLVWLLPSAFGAEIVVQVVDASGAVVVNAQVELINDASGARWQVATGEDGLAQFAGVSGPAWRVAASKAGFRPVEHTVSGPAGRVELRLEPATVFEEVRVTHILGLAEEMLEVPGSVSRLNAAELRRARVFNLDEALRKVPGVFTRAEEGFGLRPNIGIRGLNPTRSTKLLLLEDGVPITLAPYGDNATYYHPPVERFETIEVIKGGGQILYGPQTVGGVLNYVTPQPPSRRAGAVGLAGGNRDYWNAQAQYGDTVRQTGFLIDAMRKQGRGSRDNLRHGLADFNAKVLRPFGSRQHVTLKANYWIEDSNVTYSGLRLEEYLQNPRGNPFRNDFFYVNRFGSSGSHAVSLSPATVLNTTAYGYLVERNWWRQSSNSNQRPNDSADPACGGMANLNTTCGNEGRLRNYSVWGVEPRVRTQQRWLGIRNDVDFGGRIHHELQERQQQNGPLPTSRRGVVVENNQRRNQAYSGFIQNRLALGKVSITPGLRLEHVRYERWNRLNNARGRTDLTQWIPGVGVLYAPAAALAVFAGLHRGFAPPRTEDIINNTTGGVVDLEPELSWNWEAGLRTRARGAAFEATYFRTDFENQIIPASLAGGVGATLTSAGRTLHEGFELSGQREWRNVGGSRHSLYLRGAFTYVARAEFRGVRYSNVSGFGNVLVTGRRLPYSPAALVNATAGYVHASGFNAMLEAVYTGRQFGDDLNTVNSTADGQRGAIPSNTIWNATLNYPLERWKAAVFVTSKNLFDRLYIADRVRGILPGSPRLVQAGWRWNF
jgi:Fe(3+) dicitrate transport protein